VDRNILLISHYKFAPHDLKGVGASFGQLITNVMVSRLVLNLRYSSVPTEHDTILSRFNAQKKIVDPSFLTRTIGNLGEDWIASGSSPEDARNENLELSVMNTSTFSRNI